MAHLFFFFGGAPQSLAHAPPHFIKWRMWKAKTCARRFCGAAPLCGLKKKTLCKTKKAPACRRTRFFWQQAFPATVEYERTEYGKSLRPVIEAMRDWGRKHREKVVEEFSNV